MPSVLILSDTHGYLDPRIWKYVEACDEVWHGGDIGHTDVLEEIKKHKPLQAVYGNIDGPELRHSLPLIHHFRCGEIAIGMTHIAGTPASYKPDAKKLLSESVPDILVCGHSHILKVMRDPKHNNLLFINPGAIGVHGFHTVQTMIRLTIEGKRISDLNVVELKRAKVS